MKTLKSQENLIKSTTDKRIANLRKKLGSECKRIEKLLAVGDKFKKEGEGV